MKASRDLVFVEYPGQIPVATKAAEALDHAALVALTPHAEFYLERMGYEYFRPGDFCTDEEQEAIGAPYFKKVDDLCALVDSYVARFVPDFGERGLTPAWFHYYWIKILFDAVVQRLAVIQSLIRGFSPGAITYFAPRKPALGGRLITIDESLYGQLLRLVCSQAGVSSHEIPYSGPGGLEKASGKPGGWRARYISAARDQLRNTPARLFYHLLMGSTEPSLVWQPDITAPAGKPRIAVLQYADVDYLRDVVRELESMGAWVCSKEEQRRPWFQLSGRRMKTLLSDYRELKIGRELKRCWDNLTQDPIFRGFFDYGSWNWLEVTILRWQTFFQDICVNQYREYEQAIDWLDRTKAQALLTGYIGSGGGAAISHAARSRQVPVLVLPHGSMGTHYCPRHRYADYLWADIMLAFGDGVGEYFRRRFGNSMQSITTGAPQLDRIRRKTGDREALCRKLHLDPKMLVVVYVLNDLTGNFRYLGHTIPSDSSVFHIQRSIVAAFAVRSDIQYIVKGKPNVDALASPIKEYIADKGKANCVFESSMPFPELLGIADAFIFDYPMTAFLDALTTDKPIYVYVNPLIHWEPEALEAMRTGAVCETDLRTFCERLEEDLGSGAIFSWRGTDDTFLRLYGDPVGDGNSARRAALATLTVADHCKSVTPGCERPA